MQAKCFEAFRRIRRYVPVIVALLSVIITLVMTLQLDTAMRQRDATRFDAWVDKTHDNAQDRIYTHTKLLRGVLGLFRASNEVTATDFQMFVDSFELEERYPSVKGVGFAIETPHEQRSKVVDALKAQQASGSIWPGEDWGTIYPTVYFYAADARYEHLLGFDISSDPVGWQAMQRSRRLLRETVAVDPSADPFMLPRDSEPRMVSVEEERRHFTLYLPVFREDLRPDRRPGPGSRVMGYLYAVIDTDLFWEKEFHTRSRHYFDIYACSGEQLDMSRLAFASRGITSVQTGPDGPRFQKTVRVDIADQPWTLLFQSRPTFEAISSRPVVVPLMFGVGLLASLVFYALTESQRRAWMTAREANAGLQRTDACLREVNESLEHRVAERTAVAHRRTAQVRQLAAEVSQIEQRERRRLAKTLHDHLQQLLIAARFRLQVLDGETIEGERGDLDQLLRDAIDATRSLTVELSPPVLQESGLVDCLRWLGKQYERQHRLHVDVQVVGEAAALDAMVAPNVKVMLFESVRESLLNVVKYATVDHAEVRLMYDGDAEMLELRVCDDGVGFEADKLVTRGSEVERFGLFSIRERADLLDGELHVVSQPGEGTCITLRLPARRPTSVA